jgi:tRNA threonylcarbamoyladenosine biosynthesis protein TsaE
MKTISLKDISELPLAAKAILEFAEAKTSRILCFYGELGAGKTTLIKEICKQLGVTDAGSSPTFSLVNEYHHPSPPPSFAPNLPSNPVVHKGESQSQIPVHTSSSPLGRSGGVLYHFDLYRLKSESEIYDIGYEEYLFSGNYCFIEWPEKMEHLLPKNYVQVRIEVGNCERIICIA